MPAVLSGVTAVITSAVAVLCVILATLSSSPAGSLFFVAFFAYIFSSVCVAIIRRVPVRGRRIIVVAVIISRGARIVTISAVSSSLTSTIASTGGSRFLVRCRIQRGLGTAYNIFASRTFIFSGNLSRICMAWYDVARAAISSNFDELPSPCLSHSSTV